MPTPTALITSYSTTQTSDESTVEIKYIIQSGDANAITYNEAMSVMPAGNSIETINGIDCFMSNRTVSTVDGALAKVWEGSATWSDQSPESTDAGFISKDMQTSAIATDFWREISIPPDINNPSDNDIGGEPIDSFGDPVTVFVPQQELSVTNYRADNNATAIMAAVGKRNSLLYNGAAAGSLVFVGASARRVKINWYEVVYKMTFDPCGHCRQVALADSAGVKMGPETGNPPRCNASLVVWRQPFPLTTSFADIGIVL